MSKSEINDNYYVPFSRTLGSHSSIPIGYDLPGTLPRVAESLDCSLAGHSAGLTEMTRALWTMLSVDDVMLVLRGYDFLALKMK